MTELYHVYLIEVDEMFKNAEAFIHYPNTLNWFFPGGGVLRGGGWWQFFSSKG